MLYDTLNKVVYEDVSMISHGFSALVQEAMNRCARALFISFGLFLSTLFNIHPLSSSLMQKISENNKNKYQELLASQLVVYSSLTLRLS